MKSIGVGLGSILQKVSERFLCHTHPTRDLICLELRNNLFRVCSMLPISYVEHTSEQRPWTWLFPMLNLGSIVWYLSVSLLEAYSASQTRYLPKKTLLSRVLNCPTCPSVRSSIRTS